MGCPHGFIGNCDACAALQYMASRTTNATAAQPFGYQVMNQGNQGQGLGQPMQQGYASADAAMALAVGLSAQVFALELEVKSLRALVNEIKNRVL